MQADYMALMGEPRHWCSTAPLELKYMVSSNEEFCNFLLQSPSHIVCSKPRIFVYDLNFLASEP